MFKLIISSVDDQPISWLQFVPTMSVAAAFIVGLIAAVIAYKNVSRQLANGRLLAASNYWEGRADALRSKRATAKSLLQEIETMRPYLEKGISVTPVVFPKLVDGIGRLSTACIGPVIGFYTELSIFSSERETGKAPDKSVAKAIADKAVTELTKFMDDTRKELDDAQDRIRQHKLPGVR
ncbi:hypothetical protein ACC668_17650 [Rhizobium ruizarguesonis]